MPPIIQNKVVYLKKSAFRNDKDRYKGDLCLALKHI